MAVSSNTYNRLVLHTFSIYNYNTYNYFLLHAFFIFPFTCNAILRVNILRYLCVDRLNLLAKAYIDIQYEFILK